MPLPKTKHGDADDMEDKDAVEEQAKEDLGDNTESDEAPRDHQQMQMQLERLAIP